MKRRFALFLCVILTGLTNPALANESAKSRDFLMRGIRSFNAGDVRTARVETLNALQADPANALAHAIQGRIFLALNDGSGAQAELDRALAQGMPRVRIGHLIGHAALLQGRFDDAFAATDPTIVPPTFRAYAARIRAKTFYETGDFVSANQAFDTAITLTPRASILWSDIGRFRMQTGNQAGAIEAASLAMQYDPRNVDGLILTGELLRSQYGLIAAIPWFERALLIDPNNINAMSELAATLGDAGRNRDMLTVTRKILSLDPKNPRAFYLQAVLAARANNPDLARALLYKIGDQLETVPAVMLVRAILEIQSGADEQAINRLKPLLALQPENLKVRRLLGAALSRTGDLNAALETLLPIAERGDADSYTLSIVGRAYEAAGERSEAARYLDRAAYPARAEPSPFAPRRSLDRLAMDNANRPGNAATAIPYITGLAASGRAEEALAQAVRLQTQNPGAPDASVLVGDSYALLGRHADAVAAYQKAASIKFSENTALRLISALQKSGDSPSALRALNLYMSQNPRSIAAKILAADYFMASKQWASAATTLETVKGRLGHRDALILNNLAWSYLNTQDEERALAYAKTAYNLASNNPAIVGTFGWILFKTEHDQKTGTALLEKACAIAPSHAGLRYQLAQAYAKMGRKAEARVALQRVLLAPDFQEHKAAAALLSAL
ncbi:MAG: tetratricopeptide repeat protein [Chakrabartia sp.]